MRRVLVLGAGGMAGHVVSLYLRENGYSVDTLSASSKLDDKTYLLDVADLNKFSDFLSTKKYDIIVNCIGILVKESDARKDLAILLNSYLPHYLEHKYSNSKTKIIHLSTDFVLLANKPNSHAADSDNNSPSFYDLTKTLGEINNDKDLTFRMSIIGPVLKKGGQGLFNWFWQQSGKITGYDKVLWSGITTIELAKGIKAAIDQDLTGIYHLVPKNNISKYNLLQLFKKVFGRGDIEVRPNSDVVSDRTLTNTRADFNHFVSDYPTMVQEMKNWIKEHRNLYKHYGIE